MISIFMIDSEIFLCELGRKVLTWEICFITEGRKEMKKEE